MADENKNNEDKNEKKSGEFRIPSKTLLVWIGIVAFIMVLMVFRGKTETKPTRLNYVQLVEKLEKGAISDGKIVFSQQTQNLRTIKGKYAEVDKDGSKKLIPFYSDLPDMPEFTKTLIASGKFEAEEPSTLLTNILLSFLPLLVIVAVIYFFLVRQIRMAGKGALSFGKSKARMLSKDKNK